MLMLSLDRDKGYFTCDKTKLNYSQEDDKILLNKKGNSFGWDIAVIKGKYNIGIFIKWKPDIFTIKSKEVTMIIQDSNHNISKYKNIKLNKVDGNKLTFGDIELPDSNLLYIRFETKVDIIILNGIIEYNENASAKLLELDHSGGRLCIEDVSTLETMAFYREVSISCHVPYTDYIIAFGDGYFQIQADGNRTGIVFNVSHSDNFRSLVVANNSSCIINETESNCGVLYPVSIKIKKSYKLFLKLQHDIYDGYEATFYHAFYGVVGKNIWYYIGTICRTGYHSIKKTFGCLHIDKHNGHLYTRVFKYGNGWDFNKNGEAQAIDEVMCYSSNNYTNSRTEFDNSTFRVKMFLGGGVHTKTPNESYKMKKRPAKLTPKTPFLFDIVNYINDSELINDEISDESQQTVRTHKKVFIENRILPEKQPIHPISEYVLDVPKKKYNNFVTEKPKVENRLNKNHI